MNQDIIDLRDNLPGDHSGGVTSRRAFLDGLAQLVGGATAVLALRPTLESSTGQAPIVAEADDRLVTARVEYDASGTAMKATWPDSRAGRNVPASSSSTRIAA